MARVGLSAIILALSATAALANPCGQDEAGRLVVTGYGIGQTAVPKAQGERLTRFADTARENRLICIFAQVDATGSEEANRQVARKRADAVRRYLINKGVASDSITVATQDEAFTLFGLLSSDQDDDRRVVLTHD
ncbi:MAG: OmpA family protein [Pseudomonadota bacterium]